MSLLKKIILSDDEFLSFMGHFDSESITEDNTFLDMKFIIKDKEILPKVKGLRLKIHKINYKGINVLEVFLNEAHELFPNLVSLDVIPNCDIQVYVNKLPKDIFRFKHLREIRLDNVNIRSGILPKQYFSNPTIVELHLFGCGINLVELPDKKNEIIKIIDLRGNNLSDLNFIEYLSSKHIWVDDFSPYIKEINKDFDIHRLNFIINIIFRTYLSSWLPLKSEFTKTKEILTKNIALSINSSLSRKALNKIEELERDYDPTIE